MSSFFILSNKTSSKYIFADNITNFENIPLDVQQYLLDNKKKLIEREIKKFDESNWWCYGALRNFEVMSSNRKRIYGIMKTRESEIFWKGNEFEFFGGGIVGLFLKIDIDINLDDVVRYLNSEEFKKIFSELEKKFGNLDGELIFDSYFSTLRINIKNKGINKNDILNFIYKLK
jgi:hypothetical protein